MAAVAESVACFTGQRASYVPRFRSQSSRWIPQFPLYSFTQKLFSGVHTSSPRDQNQETRIDAHLMKWAGYHQTQYTSYTPTLTLTSSPSLYLLSQCPRTASRVAAELSFNTFVLPVSHARPRLCLSSAATAPLCPAELEYRPSPPFPRLAAALSCVAVSNTLVIPSRGPPATLTALSFTWEPAPQHPTFVAVSQSIVARSKSVVVPRKTLILREAAARSSEQRHNNVQRKDFFL